MARYLKTKIGISVFSISIIVLTPLLESNFNTPATTKRWSKLSWEDFQGFVPFFSDYDAAISSTVYLEYDSLNNYFYAYAGQRNVESWVKKADNINLDYLLNHEQYHFNITEIFARRMNAYIRDHPGESEFYYQLRLETDAVDLRKMQNQYDEEAGHGKILHEQRKWEYKIDSMLALDSGWVTDNFSGAQIYFPSKMKLDKVITRDGRRWREYSARRYEMGFELTSLQNESMNTSILKTMLDYYPTSRTRLVSFTIDTTSMPVYARTITKDTAHTTSESLWVYDKKYLYIISAVYPNQRGDTTGFSKIAGSFINSFRIVNTDSFWIAKYKGLSKNVVRSTKTSVMLPNDKKNFGCFTMGQSTPHGLYRGPFFNNDGSLFLAFDFIERKPSDVHEAMLAAEKKFYHYKPDSAGTLCFIPFDELPERDFSLRFGYTLKADSMEQCYQYYYQELKMIRIPGRSESDGAASHQTQ
jgi:hypothetical protein